MSTKHNAWTNRMTSDLSKASRFLFSSLSFSFKSKSIFFSKTSSLSCGFLRKSLLLSKKSSCFFSLMSKSLFFCDSSS